MICLSTTIYRALVTYVATLIGAEMRWVCVCVCDTKHATFMGSVVLSGPHSIHYYKGR